MLMGSLPLPVHALGDPGRVNPYTTLTNANQFLLGLENADAPAGLDNPISLVRVQSSYQAGSDIAVTYTVRNNLFPTVLPDVAPTANYTDTAAAILTTDFAGDPHTIEGVVVAVELTDPASDLVASDYPIDQDGDILLINVGDLGPLESKEVVLTVSTPAVAGTFISLDGGATAHGNWQARPVTSQSAPITLAPDGFAPFLVCTPDANCNDPYIVRQAGLLGNDPSAIFAFVRGLGYESYDGSLRGARGTLWSEAGNGYDQASLLIALLRASGVPTAYREGTLSTPDAQTLLNDMFPAPAAVSGLVPAGADVADPLNDPLLLASAQSHAWVEAYLPTAGSWTTLDPSFPTANEGDLFGVATSGQLPELPDTVRHKVTVSLEVEKYSTFPVGGSNLYTLDSPLSATFNTVSLIGEPLVFAHVVESSEPGGMVFASTEHTYTPYFIAGVDETLVEGTPFGEIISNFPFGQDFIVAEWLNFTVTDPAGNSETYRRELFDDIGFEVREGGGLVGELARDTSPRVSTAASWNTLFAPSDIDPNAYLDTYAETVALAPEVVSAREAIEGMGDTDFPTAEMIEAATYAVSVFGQMTRLVQQQHLLQFTALSDAGHDYLADAHMVKSYQDSPRVFTVGWDYIESTGESSVSFDLGRNKQRVLAYPGQTDIGAQGFRYTQALLDMSLESQVLEAVAPEPVISVSAVFDQAIADDLEFVRITYGTLDELDTLNISEEAKARIISALADNNRKFIIIPESEVTIPGTDPMVGWLEIDSDTLETIDVMENGQHMAATQYAILGKFGQKISSLVGGFGAGFVGSTFGFWVGFFQTINAGGDGLQALANGKASAKRYGEMGKKACNKKSDKKMCKAGAAAGMSVGMSIISDADPPVQDTYMVLPFDYPEVNETSSALVNAPAGIAGNTITVNTDTNLSAIHGTFDASWDTSTANSYAFDSLTISSADVYSGGILIDSGAIVAVPAGDNPTSTAQSDATNLTVSGTMTGSTSHHALATNPIGAGSDWTAYDLDLTPAGTTDLTIENVLLDVNGTLYSGDFVLQTNQIAELTGFGTSSAPNHSANMTATATDNGYTVFAPTSNPTVGGGSVSAPNGFALGNANGTATVSASVAMSDTFDFNGTADFFTLDLSATSSVIASGSATNFDALINANFTDDYTTTIYAPAGWDTTLDTNGQITAQTPLGLTAGTYRLLISARSETYPDLYVTAIHTVTVTDSDGVVVAVALDPVYTVPWGPYGSDVINFDTREGQFQLPSAAFTVDVTNTSSVERTFDVVVTGLPAGWSVFSGQVGNSTTQVTLAAGERAQLGLYILPTTPSLDPPGTSTPFTVTATATDNPAVNDSDNDTFTVAAVAYPGLVLDPVEINAGANTTVTFDLALTNIGTAPGTFDLQTTVPADDWTVQPLPNPSVTLNPGETATQTVSVAVTTGQAGIDYPVSIGAPAVGVPYTPTVAVDIYITGLNAGIIYDSADDVLACTGDVTLASAFEGLADAVNVLEASCSAGACNPNDKLASEASAEQLSTIASRMPGVDTTDLDTATTSLMSAGDDTATLTALGDISSAVVGLTTNVCEAAQHMPGLVWTPGYNAGLPSQPVPYDLTLTNLGTVTTSYALTSTFDGIPATFNPTLAPGESIDYNFNFAPSDLGLFDLLAEATAVGPDVELSDLTATATAQHNVVDRFVQILAVNPNPAFVETGVSSTDLSVSVANVANTVQPVTARTEIIHPSGGLSYTIDMPLTVVPGNPQIYDLGTVDTSGWDEGIYTVSVELLDDTLTLVPDGSGYGLFAVGQGLAAQHDVLPDTVAPGTMTVTTVITTEILEETIYGGNAPAGYLFTPTGLRDPSNNSDIPVDEPAPEPERETEDVLADPEPELSPSLNTVTGTIILRQEQDEATLTGSWASLNQSRASNGSYLRGDAIGETATFTFDGSWVNVGFIGGRRSGEAEIFVDGSSLGTVDLYRHTDNTPVSVVYSGLVTATHTLSVTVLGTSNPNASDFEVQLDYLDSWNGGTYANGTTEAEDGARVFYPAGWTSTNDATASNGNYIRSNSRTLWYPFTGDSVSFDYLRTPLVNGTMRVFVDGQFVTQINIANGFSVVETLSLDGLGAGPHILEVQQYRGFSIADNFTTPGSAPFYTPPVPSGYWRYEIDDPAILFNGAPLVQADTSWTRAFYGENSDEQIVGSETAGDQAELTFNGEWVAIGFRGHQNGGEAELFIDGLSQGVVDTYRTENDAFYVAYAVTPGVHTVRVDVLGTQNAFSNDNEVDIDFFDVWDGTGLPNGTFDQSDPRILQGGFEETADANASGGYYMESDQPGTAWVPFLGDSISVQAFDFSRGHEMEIRIDGVSMGLYDVRATGSPTPTYHFDGLGAGLHILQIRDYRDNASLDAVHIPALAPPPPPDPATPYTRYEESDPGFLFNGVPFLHTSRTWDRLANAEGRSSDGQIISSDAAGDSFSFDFTAPWVEVGFATENDGGQAEIFIDGLSQGIVDLYRTDGDVVAFQYGGLANAPHTLTVNVLGTSNPFSTDAEVALDYVATWDGTAIPAGTFEESDSRVYRSDLYDEWFIIGDASASGGQYMSDDFFSNDGTVWFPFEGDSVSFVGVADDDGGQVTVRVDGNHVADLRLYSAVAESRVFSFDGFGPGAHVIEIRKKYGEPNIDAFTAPASGPIYQTPVFTGLMRFEEDHSDLVYNGAYAFPVRPRSWALRTNQSQVSNWGHVDSNDAGDSISLTFNGEWVNAGFRTRSSASMAEIFIDGISQGIFDLQNPAGESHRSIPFGGLAPGVHTINVVVVSGTVYFDFFDVWDGQATSDDYIDAERGVDSGRMHVSSSSDMVINPNAINGSYLVSSLLNTNTNAWFTFVGDSFTLLGFSRDNTTHVDVYVDGALVSNESFDYPFSEQPLARHFTGFGPGAHVVRIDNGLSMRVDAFRSNPPTLTPYSPLVEWYDFTPGGNGAPFFGTAGIVSSIATGDIDNDGIVEILASADDLNNFGTLFAFRGDGQDTGDGDPIEWIRDFGGGAYRTWLGAPGIADLDGLPGGEIVVNAGNEVYALYNDGSTYWSVTTDDAFEALSAPAFANLDADAEPEVVINVGEHVYIFDSDGTLIWDQLFPVAMNPPVLADFTNDGIQDLLLTGWDANVYLYEYNGGTPSLAWTTPLTASMAGMFGAPAVADIDGQLPGGDAGPEIAVASFGQLSVLDADGTILWTTVLDPGNPGGVAIADIDGDSEVEMVVSMRYDDGIGLGRMYAINADGSILWSQQAYDSTSANSTSVIDINGDGVYEVAWNGKEQGFTLYNGADGAILFNEPLVSSQTGTDYPAFADVDNDGFSEVIAPGLRGIHVIGFDNAWDNARSVWNQHNYHITNINDDLTVPFTEANSWDVHNTYRTQTNLSNPQPVYGVDITHTVGMTNVTVLSDTFNVTPGLEADPEYGWAYLQTGSASVVTRTFDSRLDDLRPGTARLVAEGTEVTYLLAGGENRLTLPPLYVSVPHIISLAPPTQTVGAGGMVSYDVLLSNPSDSADNYDLAISGLPAEWTTLPSPVAIGANSDVVVQLMVAVPAGASPASYDFNVEVTNGSGGQDSVPGQLNIIDLLDISISPASQISDPGVPVSYTVTVTNYETVARQYDLSSAGVPIVNMPATLLVPAGSTVDFDAGVQSDTTGVNLFSITATTDNGLGSDTAEATLEIEGENELTVALSPSIVDTGPAVSAMMSVTVTNLGNVEELVNLEAVVPAGWTAELQQNGRPVGTLSLNPLAFNSAEVTLLVTPPAGTLAGSYPVSVVATGGAGLNPLVPMASDSGMVNVGTEGVNIAIISGDTTLDPGDTGNWQVQVTNTGSSADTFDLAAFGFFAGAATFSPSSVTLAGGASQTVNLSATGFEFVTAQTVLLGINAQSQTDSTLISTDSLGVDLNAIEGVEVTWLPNYQEIAVGETATYLVEIHNTGNTVVEYDFSASVPAGVFLTNSATTISLPAHSTTYVVVEALGQTAGLYTLTGTAQSTSSSTNGNGTATLLVGVPTSIGLLDVGVNPAGVPLPIIITTSILMLLSLLVLLRRRYQ